MDANNENFRCSGVASIVLSNSKRNPWSATAPGGFLASKAVFSLVFSLISPKSAGELFPGYALDECLHPPGTVLLHLVCDVAVDIQREGGGGVAQVALDSLDVIAAFYRGHGIRVSKLVEAENEGILMEVENGT